MNGGPQATDATLVMGPSGVGKTIFGLRWIAHALEQGQRCLYVTFQDTPRAAHRHGRTFGWDIGAAQASGRLAISYVPMGDLDLDVLASAIRAELASHSVSRVVIDSLAELVFAARESERFPAFMRSLVGLIRAAGSSSLVTSETAGRGLATQSLDGLMFLFDNVIDLRYIEKESGVGRALNVVKMRNSRHETTLTSFTIADHGVIDRRAARGSHRTAGLERAANGRLASRRLSGARRALLTQAGTAANRVNVKVAPRPIEPTASTPPPWRSMIWRTLASPTPVPEKALAVCRRWNGVNSLSCRSESKPAPSSRT